MTASSARLWKRLVAAGIASGPEPAEGETSAPWYVTAMVGIGAWLAAGFLLAFVGIGLYRTLSSFGSAGILGAMMSGLAVVVLHLSRESVFVSQFAVAASLAGQALVAGALVLSFGPRAAMWFALAVFEMLLIARAPDTVHRVLSTVAAAFAWRMTLGATGFAALYPAVLAVAFIAVQMREARAPDGDSPWPAVAAGIALAVVLDVPLRPMINSLPGLYGAKQWVVVPWWAGVLALGGVFIGAIGSLLRGVGVAWSSRTGVLALAAGTAIAVAAWPVPGLLVALVVLLFAFAGGRPALLGLAILALLETLALYYYSLQSTLLVKAAVLFATGVVLVGARFAMRRVQCGPTERADA